MIFSIIIIAIVLVITYLHYLNGAFTAAISLGCAFMGALVAFGYYESVLNAVGGSKYGDVAGGLLLYLLFSFTYRILRTVFDSAIPGNIALPLYVDRVGAAVFGLGAGIIGAGVIAVAAQLLPFGPSIAGYAKYEVHDRDVIVPQASSGRRNALDSAVQDEMVSDNLSPAAASGILLPVDNMVLSLVSLSSDGAYSGSQSFAEVHPDLTTEAFGARLGSEHSGNRLAINTSKGKSVGVTGLFTLGSGITGADAEITDIRPGKSAVTLKNDASDAFVIVRISFEDAASDKDGYVRLTPAAARLHLSGVDYRPIGTMDTATKIGLNRVDDQIVVPMQGAVRAVDLVYQVPKATADDLAKGGPAAASAFVEVKLFGRVNLAGVPVAPYAGLGNTVGVVRKVGTPLHPVVPTVR